MTPEEFEQLVREKVTIAITVYGAIRNIKASSEAVGGQNTTAKDAEGNQGKNTAQHQNKKQKIGETSDAGQNVKRGYAEKLPYCGSCDEHHTGHCTIVCNQCKMVGYTTRDCRNSASEAKAMMARDAGRGYKGKLPYCNKCGKHHTGHCTNICNKCKRYGHMAKDCKVAAPKPITAVPMTCYDCGEVGHYKKNCPKLKKQTLKQPKEEPI